MHGAYIREQQKHGTEEAWVWVWILLLGLRLRFSGLELPRYMVQQRARGPVGQP